MNATDKLKELMALCKASVSVIINDHRDMYEPIAEYVSEQKDLDPEVASKMVELDTSIRVQAYPNTPISFCYAVHWDLDAALDDVLERVKDLKQHWFEAVGDE